MEALEPGLGAACGRRCSPPLILTSTPNLLSNNSESSPVEPKSRTMGSGKNRLQIANKPRKKPTLNLPPVLSEGTTVNNTTKFEPLLVPTSKLLPFLKDPMAAIYTISDDSGALPSPIIPIKRSTTLEIIGVCASHQVVMSQLKPTKLLAAKQDLKFTPPNHGTSVFAKTLEAVTQIHRSFTTTNIQSLSTLFNPRSCTDLRSNQLPSGKTSKAARAQPAH
ncbi:hypothetical protein NDU88_006543 [Pleurodeles waltl]|uniref:Uncharacterized protein n=1 Tax=Pleurodeles waltl TaxID=8319 RepID=A0AAV7SQ67_PLEWA|nr:hypothetical protein NDU88_006543 [Pleurodeles waltl]